MVHFPPRYSTWPSPHHHHRYIIERRISNHQLFHLIYNVVLYTATILDHFSIRSALMYHCKNDRSFRPETTLWSYHTLLSRYPDTSDVQFPRKQYVIVWRCPLLIVPLKYTIRRPERVATSQRVFARRPPTHHRSSKRFPPPLRYPVSQSTPWLIWPWHPIQKFRYWTAIRMACDSQIQNVPNEVVHWPRFGCDWRSYSLARTDIVAMTIRHAHNNNSTVTVGQ